MNALAPQQINVAIPVPLTPPGAPDLALLVAAGREHDAAEYHRRLAAVGEIAALIRATPHGDRRALWGRVAAGHGISVNTLRRWESAWRAQGPTGLLPVHGGANYRHYRALPPGLQARIKTAFLTPQRQSFAQIMRFTVAPWCQETGNPLPDRGTVARWIHREITPSEEVAGRWGRKAWDAQIRAHVNRDYDQLAANEIWCADHRRLDFLVLSPTGRPIRPWVTAFLDLKSAAWVAMRPSVQPNAQRVALALRDGILEFGPPRYVYLDNGKDFQARALQGADPTPDDIEQATRWPAGLPWQIERLGVLRTLGIQTITAIPYHAWSKPVESMFRAFFGAFENLLPGWTGNNELSRPEALKKQVARGALLTWPQFAELLNRQRLQWLESHCAGDRKLPPIAYFSAVNAVPVESALLDLLMQRVERRVVHQDGVVVADVRFFSPDLALHVGESVQLLYDPDNLSTVTLFFSRDRSRLVVPRAQLASWHEWDAARQDAADAQKLQRQALATTIAELRPYRDPDALDPLGAVRAVGARQAAESSSVSVGADPCSSAGAEAAAILADQRAAVQAALADADESRTQRRLAGRATADRWARWHALRSPAATGAAGA